MMNNIVISIGNITIIIFVTEMLLLVIGSLTTTGEAGDGSGQPGLCPLLRKCQRLASVAAFSVEQ